MLTETQDEHDRAGHDVEGVQPPDRADGSVNTYSE